MTGVQVPAGALMRLFLFVTASRPASYPMHNAGSYPVSKAAGAWSWPTTHLHLVPRLRMSGTISPLSQHVFMVWYLVKGKDNFTCTLYLSELYQFPLRHRHPCQLPTCVMPMCLFLDCHSRDMKSWTLLSKIPRHAYSARKFWRVRMSGEWFQYNSPSHSSRAISAVMEPDEHPRGGATNKKRDEKTIHP
jgi:hypothetical protein